MPTRSARTLWRGGIQDGSGQVWLEGSGLGVFDVSLRRRVALDALDVTSPEEFIAAAHASCYAMACSSEIDLLGGAVVSLDVTASALLEPDPTGGFRICRVRLTVRGVVEGIDEVDFLTAAERAKSACPVSKALAGTTIVLDAALA